MSLLSLINIFSRSITEATSSLLTVYYKGTDEPSTKGSLEEVSDCIFSILPELEDNERVFLIDSLEALLIEQTLASPSLFSLLESYLQNSPDSPYIDDLESTNNNAYKCCYKEIALQLQEYYTSQFEIQVFLTNISFTGFIYKIKKDIVYLVDNLTEPTLIYAIPICKILSYKQLLALPEPRRE